MPFTPGKFHPGDRERERGRDSGFATRKIAGGEGEKNCMKRENDTYGTVVGQREREGGGSRRGWWPARSGPFVRPVVLWRLRSRDVTPARSRATLSLACDLRRPRGRRSNDEGSRAPRKWFRLTESIVDRRSRDEKRDAQGCLRVTSSRLKRSSLSLFLSLLLSFANSRGIRRK